MSTIRVGRRKIELSNRDKIFFPDAGLTKGDLVQYYQRIAETMLPYLRGRPLTLHRFPDGIEEEGFYQQQASDYFPDWIERATVDKEGGTVTHVVCNDATTLAYLAGQAVVTAHAWLSRVDRPHHPDRMVFDFDPPESGSDSDFEAVRTGARAVKELLTELRLPAYLMTTGSRGLHVVTPLDRSADFDTVRAFARGIAAVAGERYPEQLTTRHRKEKREGKVFVDTTRNAYAQTAVAPYAVRARPGAPVATPLDWDELGHHDLHARRYTIGNIFRRLSQKTDPWKNINRHGRAITEPSRRLDLLRDERGRGAGP